MKDIDEQLAEILETCIGEIATESKFNILLPDGYNLILVVESGNTTAREMANFGRRVKVLHENIKVIFLPRNSGEIKGAVLEEIKGDETDV